MVLTKTIGRLPVDQNSRVCCWSNIYGHLYVKINRLPSFFLPGARIRSYLSPKA